MKDTAFEINFDGIPGPTHNYSGLSYGNIASEENRLTVSNPKAAALQSLAKMKFLADLGVGQAVLPPHERPDITMLRRLGYTGSDQEVLAKVSAETPELLSACSSAAGMWTANAATISPSADTADGKVHITAANLCSNFHRMIEANNTAKVLKRIFADPEFFSHHPPLPNTLLFSDEGAANHSRICQDYGQRGIELFVYGREPFNMQMKSPQIYPGRQSLAASQAIARTHQLNPGYTIFAQQNPVAIDAGAFHNDVVCVGNKQILFLHEEAFLDQHEILNQINFKFSKLSNSNDKIKIIEVKSIDIPLKIAVDTYLFNSQLVTLPSGETALIAPHECYQNAKTKAYLDSIKDCFQVHYLDLRQSMRNGGGPACLRLRVALKEQELAATSPHVFMDALLYTKLVNWVEEHYRDKLHPSDLADPKLINEVHTALDELTQILNLGSIYPFQV